MIGAISSLPAASYASASEAPRGGARATETEGPSAEKAGKSDGKAGEQTAGTAPAGASEALTEEEQKAVRALEARDREVRAHEAAHMRAGGDLVRGSASFSFQRGPDGQQYAVGGEVSIDTSSGRTPEETIAKADRVRAAALAPAEPSGQDMAVAAEAARMAAQARAELAATKGNPYQPKVSAERGAVVDEYA
ncbi:MAG: hypothetical protein KDG55_11665 [Rhodocyclaceae bacterium]|nr:hypothetical protein [Rhodocyclaceae bacterium]